MRNNRLMGIMLLSGCCGNSGFHLVLNSEVSVLCNLSQRLQHLRCGVSHPGVTVGNHGSTIPLGTQQVKM